MVDLPAFILLLDLDPYFRCLEVAGVKITMNILFSLCFSCCLDLERVSLARQGLQRWSGLCVSGEMVTWTVSSLLVKTISLFRRTCFIFRENNILKVFRIAVQLHLSFLLGRTTSFILLSLPWVSEWVSWSVGYRWWDLCTRPGHFLAEQQALLFSQMCVLKKRERGNFVSKTS